MNCVANSNQSRVQAAEPVHLSISNQPDVLLARQKGREFAMGLGFGGSDVTVVAAAVCEIARNMVDYAQGGQMRFSCIHSVNRIGMLVVAEDEGPGIANVDQALRYGCSTRKGLGVGLPGAKWLMDEFDLRSEPGQGTRVKMVKWLPVQEKGAGAYAPAPLPTQVPINSLET